MAHKEEEIQGGRGSGGGAGKEGGFYETEYQKLSSEKSQRQVRKYDSNSKERGAARGLVENAGKDLARNLKRGVRRGQLFSRRNRPRECQKLV